MSGAAAPAERLFLDACVLYPRLPRALLLGAAEAGLFAPAWSPRVIAEWRHAAVREAGAAAAAEVERLAAALRAAFPGGEAVPDPGLEAGLSLPDAADAHVLAGAVAAGAVAIVTFNLRDFPARRLAPHGVAARHPDGLLWECLSRAPEAMAAVTRAAFAPLDAAGPRAERNALKRAHLARFGRAWEALA